MNIIPVERILAGENGHLQLLGTHLGLLSTLHHHLLRLRPPGSRVHPNRPLSSHLPDYCLLTVQHHP